MTNCTCVPGFFLCPEAVRLWAEHNAAYQRKDWDEHKKTNDRYNEHINSVKEKSK